jgi:polyphosphate glucokinase
MAFGAGRDRQGLVLIVTIGTGLGTALFTDDHLVPNLELGHIEINCLEAERRASDMVRKTEKLSWKAWAKRLDEYLHRLEALIWPDLFILGGGVIKSYEKFIPLLTVEAEVLPAGLLNDAGMIGAALAARQKFAAE